MLGKEEQKQLNIQFWGRFDEIMSGTPSAFSKKKVNWATYKLKIKSMYLRITPGGKNTELALEFQNRYEGVRKLQLEQFSELRKLLEGMLGHKIEVQEDIQRDHFFLDRVVLTRISGNYYLEGEWNDIIFGLKPSLIAFDEFWSDFYDLFKELEG